MKITEALQQFLDALRSTLRERLPDKLVDEEGNEVPDPGLDAVAYLRDGMQQAVDAVSGTLEDDSAPDIQRESIANDTGELTQELDRRVRDLEEAEQDSGPGPGDTIPAIHDEAGAAGTSEEYVRDDTRPGLLLRKNTANPVQAISALMFGSADSGLQLRIAAAADEDAERSATALATPTVEVVPDGGAQAKLAILDSGYETNPARAHLAAAAAEAMKFSKGGMYLPLNPNGCLSGGASGAMVIIDETLAIADNTLKVASPYATADTTSQITSKTAYGGGANTKTAMKSDGWPGLKLVGTPDDGTAAGYASLQFTTSSGGLQVKIDSTNPSLQIAEGGLRVKFDSAKGIADSAGGLVMALEALGDGTGGFKFNGSGALAFNFATDPGLKIDSSGGLVVKNGNGIDRDENGIKAKLLSTGGLAFDGGSIKVNVDGSTIKINGSNQLVASGGTPAAHHATHEDGGGDEVTAPKVKMNVSTNDYVTITGYVEIVDQNGDTYKLAKVAEL